MIYTSEQLKGIIQPMILTAIKDSGDPDVRAEAASAAVINLMEQDREAFKKQAPSDTSDGYHTFKELYFYRMLLQAAWLNTQHFWDIDESSTPMKIVKSWRHHDGELCFGKENYFIVVAELPTGQVSNHYKGEYWDLFDVPEVKRAPKWDGHTPEIAAERIEQFIRGRK